MKKHLLFLSFFIALLSQAQELRTTLKASQAPFFHGVASGDPLSDKVILWTKVTPPTGSMADVDVYWEIATDVNFTNVVNFGRTKATAASDFTVKVDACGLQPATYYFFVFRALGSNSIIGRTKTAPATGMTEARFGVVSCSSYEHGYFNAYESLSKRNDLDAIIHLGDYIYEYATGGFSSSVVTGGGRTYLPGNETINLTDYRLRHSQYKLDDQLQRLHQIHPFITTWDDHETANDSYKDGAQNHDPATEGPWINRKVSGTQAYKEYMPLRNPDPLNDIKIWRKLRYGNLLDLIVIDSRLWARDLQDMGQTNNNNHHLLGNDQFTWLETQLADQTTDWKVICNQVMMAPLEILGQPVNADQWDGYNAERNRLINFVETNNVQNPVVLTGDIHTTWINNVPGNNTNNAMVEFVVTSVTSPGLDVIETALGQLPQWLLNLFGGAVNGVITGLNPHMQYVNTDDHGYMVLTVNQNKAQGDYVWLDREVIDTTDAFGPSYYVNTGNINGGFQQASGRIQPFNIAPIPPEDAVQNIPFALLLDTFQVNVNEGQFSNACLISVSNACPNIVTAILSNPTYGTASLNQFCYTYTGNANYYGTDYMTATFCQTAAPNNCDTVVIQFNIVPSENADTLHYSIESDSTLQDCISFNDLYAGIDSFYITNNTSGQFSIDSNFCFTFVPDSSFNGYHYINLIACDSVGVCDTLVLVIEIQSVDNTTIVELFGETGELISNCLGFDDLQGALISNGMAYTGTNNALEFNDTCISYTANAGFSGIDTVLLYGCDNSNPPICDTIIYLISINADSTDTTGIKQINNNDFAVMGVYPNPFDVEIIVQYYQFSHQEIVISMYDIDGKVLFSSSIGETNEGLKHARLKTEQLAPGAYIVELKTQDASYTQKVIKY